MRNLKHRFATFLRDEDGLILAEGLIMLPLIIWALVAMFIYWDVFRTINVTQKAAYSVADLLSRQRDTIPLTFFNGLQNVSDFLTPGGHPVKLRVTSNKVPELTETQINTMWRGKKIATLNNLESVFVVEMTVDFKAQLQTVLAGLLVNVTDQTFGEFIVTRPRHRRICLEGTTTCT